MNSNVYLIVDALWNIPNWSSADKRRLYDLKKKSNRLLFFFFTRKNTTCFTRFYDFHLVEGALIVTSETLEKYNWTDNRVNNSLLSTTSWMYSMVSIVNRFVFTIDVYVKNAWRFDRMTHIKLGRFSMITSSARQAHISMPNSYAIGAANPPNIMKFGISISFDGDNLIRTRFLSHKCKNFRRNRHVTSTTTFLLVLLLLLLLLLLPPLLSSIVSRLLHTLRLFTIIWINVLNSLVMSSEHTGSTVCDSIDKSF